MIVAAMPIEIAISNRVSIMAMSIDAIYYSSREFIRIYPSAFPRLTRH
jgi:hypothetical protein